MNTPETTGARVLRELMGPEHLERRKKTRNAFNAALQDYSEEVCFGRIWARGGIDRKLRSVVNIATLVALNRPNQLAHHIDGALNNGCTVEEIQEMLLQTAVYSGLPAASDAFRIAEEVLRARGLL